MPRRFSLRSLLLLILTVAAVAAASMKWDAWRLTLTIMPTGHDVGQAKFSSDGQMILTHGSVTGQSLENKRATVVFNRAGEELYRTDWCYNMGASGYDGAEFKLGSRWLLLQYMHHTSNAQLVDLRTKSMLFPDEYEVDQVAFTSDQRRCAVAIEDADGRCRLAVYDLETGVLVREERAYFNVPKRACREATISPDGRRVIAMGEDIAADNSIERYLVSYDVETGAIRRGRQHEGEFYLDRFAFSRDGSRVVLIANNDVIRVQDASTDEIVFQITDVSHYEFDYSARNNGLPFLLYQAAGETFWLDLAEPQLWPRKLPGVELEDADLRGEWVAWRGRDGKVRVRNIVTAEDVNELTRSATYNVSSWSFKKIGDYLTFYSVAGSYCFNTRTRQRFESYDTLDPSPDGSRVLVSKSKAFIFPMQGTGPARGFLESFGRNPNWAPDSNALIAIREGDKSAGVWSRVRDDAPGAFIWLPEVWLSVVFGLGFLWSVWDNVRRIRAAKSVQKSA